MVATVGRSEVLALTAEQSGGIEQAKVPRHASRPRSPRQSPSEVTTTGRTNSRISGPRSCWPVTRLSATLKTHVGRAFLPDSWTVSGWKAPPFDETKHENGRIAFWLSQLVEIGMRLQESIASGQSTSSKRNAATSASIAPKLTGDDARRAEELDKAVADALKADRWDGSVVKLQEVLALRSRVNGPTHHEMVDAKWFLKASAHSSPDARSGSRHVPVRRRLR